MSDCAVCGVPLEWVSPEDDGERPLCITCQNAEELARLRSRVAELEEHMRTLAVILSCACTDEEAECGYAITQQALQEHADRTSDDKGER